MAKKIQLSYKEIEQRLRLFKDTTIPAGEIGFSLLYAFGKGERDIIRMREGKGIIKTFDPGLLIKGEFCYRATTTLRLVAELEELKADASIRKAAPKIIAVSDGKTIRAFDTRQKESFEQQVDRLYCDFDFFYPLAGVERIEYVEESPADIKAAEKLAKLHDEIRAYNEFTSDSDLHDLNIFIARLLFCFFAEDTGIFEQNLFTDTIKRYTLEDGSDLNQFLDDAFLAMSVEEKQRPADFPTFINQFPFVSGGLFSKLIKLPKLSSRARKIIIECGDLDWQSINPDIFGSMIQSVVNPDERANQGMHYTSVPNIMKVIQPLFLDELTEEKNRLTAKLDEKKKLRDIGGMTVRQFYDSCVPIVTGCKKLLDRMYKMKFFDPACGSGNFLIITYKQLRLLEMDIWRIFQQCSRFGSIPMSRISVHQFYGIELLDFPHEITMLSLWLAEHQMNRKLLQDFGVSTEALPLKNITQIRCGNACRVDWNEVCPHTKDEEVFIFGNPPYLGSKMQSYSQKEDIKNTFGKLKNCTILDYISIWFYLGSSYIKNTKSKYAFVSTNSICQGEQVGVLWPQILKKGLNIDFAYTSFKWSNNAKHNAGVTCVIIGVGQKNNNQKVIFDKDNKISCSYISPYITKDTQTIVCKSTTVPDGLPKLCFGCMPYDNGNLLMDNVEYEEFCSKYPDYIDLVRPIYGSEEFINGKSRYCLWIDDDQLDRALTNPEIKRRIKATETSRLESKDGAELAERPHQFREHPDLVNDKIIVPSTSSENRYYIPIGYLDANDVISNSAFAIYDAPIWLFGILTSRIHMDWVRAVGGRLKTDYRYSAGLCYNTFPFPKLTEAKKSEIEEAAMDILMTRQRYLTLGKTLADLYNQDTMPQDLREAHAKLDDIVESCYPGYPFATDEARLECLFKMYEKMTKK